MNKFLEKEYILLSLKSLNISIEDLTACQFQIFILYTYKNKIP